MCFLCSFSLSDGGVCVCLGEGCLALCETREVVLEHIIERKRMDDLASSIIDGRFKEQKVKVT